MPGNGTPASKDCFVVTMTANTAQSTRKLILRGLMIGTMALAVTACGKKDRPRADLAPSQLTTIGVNAYLWRATLDALSFMPLLQTDSNGGVIVTDWYANPKNRASASRSPFRSSTRTCAPMRCGLPPAVRSRRTASGSMLLFRPPPSRSLKTSF